MFGKQIECGEKNRKPISGTFGIDLNRNYDLDWYNCGGSTIPSSETYKGPKPESEEEVQSVVNFAKVLNFAKVIDFHSYGREVLHAYHPCTKMDTRIRSYIINKSRDLALKSTYNLRDPSGNGQHQSFNIKVNTFYSFIVETHTTFQPSIDSARQEIARIYPMVIQFLNETIPLQGTISDSQTGIPLKANILLKDFQFFANETKSSNLKFGKYFLFLPQGTWNIEFSANGYQNKLISATITSEQQTIDLKLNKL